MLSQVLAFAKRASRTPDQHISHLLALMQQVHEAAEHFVIFAEASDFSSLRVSPPTEEVSIPPLNAALEERKALLAGHLSTIIEAERSADRLEHQANEAISHALMLPFDRSLLFRLLKRADDIVDAIRGAATYSVMYEAPYSANMLEMARIIHKATAELLGIIPALTNVPRGAGAISKAAEKIRLLEREVDQLHMAQLSTLMRDVNPAKLAANPLMSGRYIPARYEPMRECIDRIEAVMDKCKDFSEAMLIVVSDNT